MSPVGQLGIEHPETVVMLARDDEVAHARLLGDPHPLPRIELHRVELPHKLLILRDRDAAGSP